MTLQGYILLFYLRFVSGQGQTNTTPVCMLILSAYSNESSSIIKMSIVPYIYIDIYVYV